jgi:hypothetical protein
MGMSTAANFPLTRGEVGTYYVKDNAKTGTVCYRHLGSSFTDVHGTYSAPFNTSPGKWGAWDVAGGTVKEDMGVVGMIGPLGVGVWAFGNNGGSSCLIQIGYGSTGTENIVGVNPFRVHDAFGAGSGLGIEKGYLGLSFPISVPQGNKIGIRVSHLGTAAGYLLTDLAVTPW